MPRRGQILRMMRDRPEPDAADPSPGAEAAAWPQAVVLLSVPLILVICATLRWRVVIEAAHLMLWAGFTGAIVWRLLAIASTAGRRQTADTPSTTNTRPLPAYSIVVPMFREGAVAGDCIARLRRLDYPSALLDVMVVVGEDDPATLAALARHGDWAPLRILRLARPGRARALNAALAQAWGKYLAVFDPEDRPDPGQLREAADRFERGSSDFACLQAPIRLGQTGGDRRLRGLIETQYAAEQAVLFELTLPVLERLGGPFPIGDASRHFRVEALRRIGGWDIGGEAEAAGVSLALLREGLSSGLLHKPSLRPAPEDLRGWLPQRTLALKASLQGASPRRWRPFERGRSWRGRLGAMTLMAAMGSSAACALVQAPLAAFVVATTLLAALQGVAPLLSPADFGLLLAGLATAGLARVVASRRAGETYGWRDAALLPFYGALTSLAATHAAGELLWSVLRRGRPEREIAAGESAEASGRLAA